MTLYKFGINHKLCLTSEISHLGGVVTERTITHGKKRYRAKLLNDLKKPHNLWIVEDSKMLDGYFIFHQKWGTNLSIRLRRSVVNKWDKDSFRTFLFSPMINYVCSILDRIEKWLLQGQERD